MRKSAASSQPEKLARRKGSDIERYISSPQFKSDSAQSKARGRNPSAADLAETPELSTEELRRTYRVNKAPVTVRLDADVLAWLKSKPGKYQQHMNAVLRAVMLREIGR